MTAAVQQADMVQLKTAIMTDISTRLLRAFNEKVAVLLELFH